MEQVFTSEGALRAAKKGHLEEWIHEFLSNEGNNIPFSQGLKLEPRYFIGPMKMPLSLFTRCCGPEPELKYTIDKQGFEHRVNAIIGRLENGWDMPPLIVNYFDDQFELSDGNHRYEALIKKGVKEHYFIIWITGEKDYNSFVNKYELYKGNAPVSTLGDE